MKLLNKKQVCEALDISVGKLDTAMRNNEISYFKKGSLVRFSGDDVKLYRDNFLYRYVKAKSPNFS